MQLKLGKFWKKHTYIGNYENYQVQKNAQNE